MVARIYSPAKTAMQSGKGKTSFWVVDFEPESKKTRDPFMGYISSSDMMAQVKLKFETKEDAIAYAERNEIEFRLIEPKEPIRRAMTYSENFRYDRKVPWTH